MESHVTFFGTATMLLEIGGLRLVTDPVFDAAGAEYRLGRHTRYRKMRDTPATWRELGPIDAVLLSHDHHGDNLDRGGRELLKTVPLVLTTPAGSRRLRDRTGGSVLGLRPWQQHVLTTPGGAEIRVTGTPAQHGPWWLNPITGEVTGFLLEWAGQRAGGLYISGDTILYRGVRQLAQRHRVGAAFLHLGAGRFGTTGRIHYTFTAEEGRRTVEYLNPQSCYPIHYEGWSHFSEGRKEIERAFAGTEAASRLRWLTPGQRQTIEI